MSKVKRPTFDSVDDLPSEYGLIASAKRWDAGESIFFARELEYVKSQTYDIKFSALKARQLLPLDFETNAGANTITYHQYTQVGVAKIVSNYADDLSRADVQGKEFRSPVRTLGASYGYNIDEISHARFAKKPLTTRKAIATKRAHFVTENRIAWFGDTENNLPGFLTNPNTTEVVLAADGTGNSKKLSLIHI